MEKGVKTIITLYLDVILSIHDEQNSTFSLLFTESRENSPIHLINVYFNRLI